MRLVATEKSQQNDSAVDPWTIVHFGVGLAFGLWELPFGWSMTAAAAYEVFEQVLERSKTGQTIFTTSGPENAANVLVDLLVFAAGHQLGRAWNES